MKSIPPLMLGALMLASVQIRADEGVVAVIKTLSGSAQIIHDAVTQPVSVGTLVRDHDILKTAEESSLGLIFKDDTLISLGPKTQLVVDDFVYAPEQSKLKLAINVLSGTLHYVSGMIAKLKPEAIAVKTPSGMIGVRGTRFVVKVGDE